MISTKQYDALLEAPNPKSIHTRGQAGKQFTYLAQHAVRADLIRTFGFDGFEGQVIESELIDTKQVDEKKWMSIWRVRYQLTVRWQNENDQQPWRTSTWTEDAVGSAFGSSQADTLDQALKSAASDAMKRCAMNLGSRFGLGLYFDGYRGAILRDTVPQGGRSDEEPLDQGAVAAALAGSTPAGPDPSSSDEQAVTEAPAASESPDLNTPEGVAKEIKRLKGETK